MGIQLEARHLPALQKLYDAVVTACLRESLQLARAAMEDSGRDPADLAPLSAIADALLEVMMLDEGIEPDPACSKCGMEYVDDDTHGCPFEDEVTNP